MLRNCILASERPCQSRGLRGAGDSSVVKNTHLPGYASQRLLLRLQDGLADKNPEAFHIIFAARHQTSREAVRRPVE